jgi:AcrR family transcriptional regulator
MESSFTSFKLPPGRHGLSREHVAESQRWRLLAAAVELLADGEYRSLTSSKIARRAAVSSRAFYDHFQNVEECLAAAAEAGAESLELAVHLGCRNSTADPPGQIAGATGEALAVLAGEPCLRRLFSLETRCAAPMMGRTFSRLVALLTPRLQPLLGCQRAHASIRANLLVEAALVLVSEAAASELNPPSRLADELATLISL